MPGTEQHKVAKPEPVSVSEPVSEPEPEPTPEPEPKPTPEPVPEVVERCTDIVAGPGGVMTDEVGVVTGDLTLRTRMADDRTAVVDVQYQGADEWYAVTGARTALACAKDLDAVHAIAVALLNRPEG